MDFTELKEKPGGPISGGGWDKVYFCLASDLVSSLPNRDAGNKAVISDDIVFKTDKGWNPLYVTKDKQSINEVGNDLRDNDGYSSTFIGSHPGMKQAMRQFISEYGSEEFYLLIFNCGAQYPILFGRQCQPASLKAEVASGSKSDEEVMNTLTFTSNGPYLSAIYKGVFTAGQGVIAADDDTPDVSVGTQFITSANTGATDITDLDNPVVGSTITIFGGSDTNSSTITAAGNFSLTALMTLAVGTWIQLYVRADDDYVELARG